ncbi:MAG: YqzL family protein [Clostridiales bacterium]|jgi:hypothetical protein|nr:YqzL family protein [Clostridiales bacterium]
MLTEFAWNFFEKTGSIETLLEYYQLKKQRTEERDDDHGKGTDY